MAERNETQASSWRGAKRKPEAQCIDDVIPKIELAGQNLYHKAGGQLTIRIICEGNIEEAGAGGEMLADFGIHPGDDALVGETVIAVIFHADDQVFVDLNADDFGRAWMIFLVMVMSSGGRFEIVGRMVVGQ
jgi:hypothetical protein